MHEEKDGTLLDHFKGLGGAPIDEPACDRDATAPQA